jgi:biopolymer transport protein ExbD
VPGVSLPAIMVDMAPVSSAPQSTQMDLAPGPVMQQADASPPEPAPRPDKPVFVTVKSDLSVAVGEDVIAREALTSTIDAATKSDKNERLYLRADKAVSYGDLMEVMNLLRNAGYLKIALVGLDGRS